MFVGRVEYVFEFAAILFVAAVGFNVGVRDFGVLYFGRKVLSVENRPVAVLFAAYITHEAHGIVYIEHVYRRIGAAAHEGGEVT